MRAFKLTNVRLDEVSLVDEPATGKKFKVFKRCAKCVSGSLLALIGKHRGTIQKLDPTFLDELRKQGVTDARGVTGTRMGDEGVKPEAVPGEVAGNEKRDDLYMIKEPEPLEADGSFKVFVGFDTFKGAPADEDLAAFVGAEMGQEILEYDFEAPSVGEGENPSWTKGVVWTKAREQAPGEALGQVGGLEGQMGTAGLPGAGVGGLGQALGPQGQEMGAVGALPGKRAKRVRKQEDFAGQIAEKAAQMETLLNEILLIIDQGTEVEPPISWSDSDMTPALAQIERGLNLIDKTLTGFKTTGVLPGALGESTRVPTWIVRHPDAGKRAKRDVPVIGLVGKQSGDMVDVVYERLAGNMGNRGWYGEATRREWVARCVDLPQDAVSEAIDSLVNGGRVTFDGRVYRLAGRVGKQYDLVENDPEVMDYAMALAEELAEDGVVGDYAEVTIYEECMNRYGRHNMTTFEKFLKDLKWWAITSGLAYLIFKSDLTPPEQEFLDALRALGGTGTLFDVLAQAQKKTPAFVYEDAVEALNALEAKGLLRIDLPNYILVSKRRVGKAALGENEQVVVRALEELGGKGTVLDVQLEILGANYGIGSELNEASDVQKVLDGLVAAGYARFDDRTMEYILTGGAR